MSTQIAMMLIALVMLVYIAERKIGYQWKRTHNGKRENEKEEEEVVAVVVHVCGVAVKG